MKMCCNRDLSRMAMHVQTRTPQLINKCNYHWQKAFYSCEGLDFVYFYTIYTFSGSNVTNEISCEKLQ